MGYDEVFNNIPANMGLNAPYNVTTNQTASVTQPGKYPWAVGFDQSVPFISNFGNQGPGHPTSGVVSFGALTPNRLGLTPGDYATLNSYQPCYATPRA